jgi:hypothetical protein
LQPIDVGDLSPPRRHAATPLDRASKELSRIGPRAEAVLKKALEGSPSAESKRRIEALLQDIGKPKVLTEQLQAGRALEALVRMGSDHGRAALESLDRKTAGSSRHWPTHSNGKPSKYVG